MTTQAMRASMFLITTIIFLSANCTSRQADTKQTTHSYCVIDSANILSIQQEDSIVMLIKALEKDIGSQIGVLTIDSLQGERIEEYSFRTASALRLGRATHDDGVLITLSLRDRVVRVEVGEGLELIIKDEIASRLIREQMAPAFQEGKFGQGLYKAIEKMSAMIRENEKLVGQKWNPDNPE